MANITTQTIRVDLSTGNVIPTAFTHQNDTARTLEFSMYNYGTPYTMTGNTVKFAYKSPIVDGAYTVITGSGMASGTVSENKVTVTLPSTYTAISGVGMLTMVITPTSGTVRPVNIRLVVQKSADGDDTVAGASDMPDYLAEVAEQYYSQYVTEDVAYLQNGVNTLDEAVYSDNYKIVTVSGNTTLEHAGINAPDGSSLGATTQWGERSARSLGILIPSTGLRVHIDDSTDPWVVGMWCYSGSTLSNFVYSPTDKKLLDVGRDIIVLPKDGAKYLRIQMRCKSEASADASYGGYRPLQFEGEDGVTAGTGDDTTILSMLSFYTMPDEALIESTYNLVSRDISVEAETLGMTVDGNSYTGAWSAFRNRWYWLTYDQNLPSGTYRLSLDYKTGTMASSYLRILWLDADGNQLLKVDLNRTSDWRHFARTVTITESPSTIYAQLLADLSNDAQLAVKNIQLTSTELEVPYLPPVTAVDSEARLMANGGMESNLTEDSSNSFDLLTAYATSTGLTLNDGVISGTNTDLKTLYLLRKTDIGGKTVSIAFESMYTGEADDGGLTISFVDDGDNVLEAVYLSESNSERFEEKLVYRVAPSGTVGIKFSIQSEDSPKIYSLRNIYLLIGSESRISSKNYETIPTKRTSVDVDARNYLARPASLHDGDLFRLSSTPDGITRCSYSDFIGMWDAFMADYPDQITKEEIGQSDPPASDQTETYPIYRYTITPLCSESYTDAGTVTKSYGYERTIFLTAGCHGIEEEGYWGLLRLMRLIYDEGYRYPTLRKLRNHVKFVIIPVWNPYGYVHFQRGMANGSSAYAYFNAADKPEETQVILDTLNQYGNALSLWVDFHTNPYAGGESARPSVPVDELKCGCYAWTPVYTDLANSLYDVACDFHNMFKTEYNYETDIFFRKVNPADNGVTSGHPNYANTILPTTILEICTNMEDFPVAQGSGGMMKIATEWYGNCLAEAIRATAK